MIPALQKIDSVGNSSAAKSQRFARAFWSFAIGAGAGTFIALGLARSPQVWAYDFTGVWRAAGHLIQGCNPYTCMRPRLPYPLGPLGYPLPAVLATLPLGLLPPYLAAGIFTAVGVGALAFVALGGPSFRVWIFASPPFVAALTLVQWSPLLTAAGVLAPLGFFAVCKPNLGLALLARRPTVWIVLGGMVLCAISFALVPTWLSDWLAGVRGLTYYKAPVTVAGGALLLLSLVRWRDPDARLLLALSILPTNLILYDQLPLFLIARTRRDMVLLFVGSWVARIVSQLTTPRWITDEIAAQEFMREPVVAFLFLPALYIVLARPATSGAPDLVDRILNRRVRWSGSRSDEGDAAE